MKITDIQIGQMLKGIIPNEPVYIVSTKSFGPEIIELTYKKTDGSVRNELIYSDRKASISLLKSGLPWTFTGDGSVFRLVSEAYRIRLAYAEFVTLWIFHPISSCPLRRKIPMLSSINCVC